MHTIRGTSRTGGTLESVRSILERLGPGNFWGRSYDPGRIPGPAHPEREAEEAVRQLQVPSHANATNRPRPRTGQVEMYLKNPLAEEQIQSLAIGLMTLKQKQQEDDYHGEF